MKLNSSTPFTPTYVKHHILRSADPAQTYASRVKGRQILLENPAGPSRTKRLCEEKKARRLSDKAKKASGVSSSRDVRRTSFWKLRKQETKCDHRPRKRRHLNVSLLGSICFYLCMHYGWATWRSFSRYRLRLQVQTTTLPPRPFQIRQLCTPSWSRLIFMAAL